MSTTTENAYVAWYFHRKHFAPLKVAMDYKDRRVALTWQPEPEGAYSVWIEKEHNEQGTYVKRWSCMKRGLIFKKAEALFNKTCRRRPS